VDLRPERMECQLKVWREQMVEDRPRTGRLFVLAATTSEEMGPGI